MALDEGAAVMRLLAGASAAVAVWVWWPFPVAGADPVADLIAMHSPRLHAAIRAWHYLAPAVAVAGLMSVGVAAGRVWLAGAGRRQAAGVLPPWPLARTDPSPALVVGEAHHPVSDREVASPDWLVIPELGLYTGILICGAIGSGKTSACMRPFARQLLGWQADDSRRRIAGLVLEVKGDFCEQVRGILADVGRADDYVELGIGGRWRWNPLGDGLLDSYSLAYTIASLINQLFGRSKEPFWQQAYVKLVRWIIELYRMAPARWVTLQDVYRCTLDPDRIEAKIAEVEALVEPPATALPFASGSVTQKGSRALPPKARTSGLTIPGDRPGPLELYAARAQLPSRRSHAPTVRPLTQSEGTWTRQFWSIGSSRSSPVLPAAMVTNVRPSDRCSSSTAVQA